jgi:hypothetical protein
MEKGNRKNGIVSKGNVASKPSLTGPIPQSSCYHPMVGIAMEIMTALLRPSLQAVALVLLICAEMKTKMLVRPATL